MAQIQLITSKLPTYKRKPISPYSCLQFTDLLDIVLDDSEYYVQRCIDIGNNRICKLVNQKSRYLYTKTNIDISRIEDLGDYTYRVPSEQEKNLFYFVDMSIGLCECPIGLLKGPCKHIARSCKTL